MPLNQVEPEGYVKKQSIQTDWGGPQQNNQISSSHTLFTSFSKRKQHGKGILSGLLPNSSNVDSESTNLGTGFSKSMNALHGGNIRALLPQIILEQNRKKFGTWQRKFDFTRTIIGYVLGIYNFYRFPFLVYKYGGVFFLAYILMMLCVGIPVAFMECTIGQYYGVGSYVAFSQMSPVFSCVSKLLTWSCVVNCWMYAVILGWLRVYASDSTSCLRGWEICDTDNYYNSPHCWTGIADDNCNDPQLSGWNNLTEGDTITQDLLYYNFKCRTVEYYCKQHGWAIIPGKRRCIDKNDQEHTIYERRYHAIQEYLYGEVLGLKRKMQSARKRALINVTLNLTKLENIHELRRMLYGGNYSIYHEQFNSTFDGESVRVFMKQLENSHDPVNMSLHQKILDSVGGQKFQRMYWTVEGQQLTESTDSSSYLILKHSSVTTWITIAVFLFEDLLKLSFLNYVLNAFPFVILIYVTYVAVNFNYAMYGIEQAFQTKDSFLDDFNDLNMWADAIGQAIYTSGIGNGVLISLSTYNNFDHNFLKDLYFTIGLSLMTSICGVLISFCSIGHYIKAYDIDVPFRSYIRSESTTSSVEFCFTAYSHFLTLIGDQNVSTLGFFFMISSFATDTAIRLVQNVIDAFAAISPRLKHHSTMVLVAVCVLGYLIQIPVLKNGGIILFVHFEYYTTQFMIPTIVAIEIGCTVFIYKASRIADNAEQMGVFSTYVFRLCIVGFMYISFIAVLSAVLINIVLEETDRFNGGIENEFSSAYGWFLVISPFIMALLSVVKQLIVIPPRRWKWLFVPLKGKDRKVQRAFLRRMQGGHRQKNASEATDQEQIRAATARMRELESRFILAMMQRRREVHQQKKEELESGKSSSHAHNHDGGNPQLPPLFASLVRVAALEFGATRKSVRQSLHDLSKQERASSVESAQQAQPSMIAKLRAAMTCANIKKCLTRKSTLTEKEQFDAEDEIEEAKEKARMRYIDMMDHIERWPGRLDESDIESEGSSVDDTVDDTDNVFS